MSTIDLNTSVGELVSHWPHSWRVFEELQIDYCCGGGKSLQDACHERGFEANGVFEKLSQAAAESGEQSGTDWRKASLSDLCDHIEQTHHVFLRKEFPQLAAMIAKVVQVHGPNHPELGDIERVFNTLRGELEAHMMKEETVLFPAVRELDDWSQQPVLPIDTVATPIQVMEHEHLLAGAALKKLRELANQYQPPDGACNTYRAVLDGLRHFESDMHQHVHKENNILFPRAKQLEIERRAR